MSDTTTPKPGATLTAAQANALPVGSVVRHFAGHAITAERMEDGWKWSDTPDTRATRIYIDGYTLLRVGPAAFAVGDVVTREQLDALPIGAVVLPEQCGKNQELTYTLYEGGWGKRDGTILYVASKQFGSSTFTIISLPSPTNPHAPGTWEWAKEQMQQGKCVKADGWREKRIIDGAQHYWAFPSGPWTTEEKRYADKDWSKSFPWSIVPDPSAAETPVETSDETPVLHIDPAAITAELDKAIPQWREEGFTVAQAIRVLRQRYEMQMQVCAYQGDSAAANGKYTKRLEEQVATLTAERDAAIREIGKSCYSMTYEHAEQIKGITAERDAALQRAEKAEAAAKVVVPEDVRKAAFNLMYSMDNGKSAAGKFILSLTDHFVDANKMVQSTHPEGSRLWAEDAMRAGLSVVHGRSMSYWEIGTIGTSFVCSGDEHWSRWADGPPTGWRIHQPAVAPSAEPSVTQLAASIEALNERIVALEGKQS